MSEKALRYNNGKRRWSLVHYKSLEPMIEVLEYGAKKYTVGDVPGDHNWKKGLKKEEILESLQRHLAELMDGDTHDSESKIHHIGHIMCNAMFYSYFMQEENKCCGDWDNTGECKCKRKN
jgi:hypothetical protein